MYASPNALCVHHAHVCVCVCVCVHTHIPFKLYIEHLISWHEQMSLVNIFKKLQGQAINWMETWH